MSKRTCNVVSRRNWRIDSDFPGGNIIVDKMEDDKAYLRPDQRDNLSAWFYWCFRLREAAGMTLQFIFKEGFGTHAQAFEPLGHTKGEDTKGHEETRRHTKGLCRAA